MRSSELVMLVVGVIFLVGITEVVLMTSQMTEVVSTGLDFLPTNLWSAAPERIDEEQRGFGHHDSLAPLERTNLDLIGNIPIEVDSQEVTIFEEEASASSELVGWLFVRNLSHLLLSLEALGAYSVEDLALLDARDRRRLWMEVSLGAAAKGEDVGAALAHWEAHMATLGDPPAAPRIPPPPPPSPLTPSVQANHHRQLVFEEPTTEARAAPEPRVQQPPPPGNHPPEPLLPDPRAPETTTEATAEPCFSSLATEDRPLNAPSSLSFDEIAMYINSSPNGRRYFGANFQRNYYENRAVPGIKSWGKPFKHLWVVMEDSPEARTLVSRTHCTVEHFPSRSNANPPTAAAAAAAEGEEAATTVAEYTCDGRPILLAPGCDAGYWGEGGPCCKAQFAMRHMLVVRKQLFDSAPIKWWGFADDDVYFVPGTMRRFLGMHEANSSTSLSSLSLSLSLSSSVAPRIVVSRGEPAGSLTFGRLGTKGSKGHTCSNPDFKVPMLQPALFNRAALLAMGPAVVDGHALTKTCAAFGITHDYALGILSWMHGLALQVKGKGKFNHEMAGGFNVTHCELMGVASCWEQGFGARVEALRSGPKGKFVLHGAKMPEHFQELERLFEEPAMQSCLGNQNYDDSQSMPHSTTTTNSSSPLEPPLLAREQLLQRSTGDAPLLTPLVPLQGYSRTPHAAKHEREFLRRMAASATMRPSFIGGAQNASFEAATPNPPPPLGSSPWEGWPVFGPADCHSAPVGNAPDLNQHT